MPLSLAERTCLRELVLARCRDWAGFHATLHAQTQLTLSQSSLDRFFSGRSDSPRTLRTLAKLFGTTPDALVGEVRLAASVVETEGDPGERVQAAGTLADSDAFRIAFQLWVEMTTRKIGLPIDPNQDLMTEIYDSWYAFFKAARELTKAIPLHKDPRSRELRRLVQLSHALLNDGMRPHLQRWQARFRRWSSQGGDRAQADGLSPQEAQQLFPDWSALRADLLSANQRLIGYLAVLERMIACPGAGPASKSSLARRLAKERRRRRR